MIELNIVSDKIKVDSLFINRKNNIIVENYYVLQEFLSVFFDIGNSNIMIEIGNKKLDSKKVYILNLLDYESVFYQTSFKKGSLMYDYVINELEEKLDETCIQINQFLDKEFSEVVCDSIVKYNLSFDIDIVKLSSQFGEFEHKVDLKEYLKIIKILLETFASKNKNKTIIVLTNENLIGDALDLIDGIFVFNLNAKSDFNIFIDEHVMNFDSSIILDHLKLNWPLVIETNKVNDLLNRYLCSYHSIKTTDIYDIEMYIVGSIFNKIMHIDRQLKFIGNILELSEPYREYIKYIEKCQ